MHQSPFSSAVGLKVLERSTYSYGTSIQIDLKQGETFYKTLCLPLSFKYTGGGRREAGTVIAVPVTSEEKQSSHDMSIPFFSVFPSFLPFFSFFL